jgi:hypothetical protein
VGILATKRLEENERVVYNPTDLERLDRHKGFICCSMQYPNAWYFDVARAKDVLFTDWVVLFLAPKYLWLPGTRFCPRNAAANYGRDVREGEEAFLALFADSVPGAYGQVRRRSAAHMECCPTDDQAEVLVADRIPAEDIIAVAVRSTSQAKNETARLRLAKAPENRYNLVVAPALFEKKVLSNLIRAGKRPVEILWSPETAK